MIKADRLLATFLTILRLDSYHPREMPVVDALRTKLERVGLELTLDKHGNLLGFWPGRGAGAGQEPVLLCAHMDTVQPTAGMEPIVRDGAVHSDGTSVLGADDKAAVAAIVEALEALADTGESHPPVEVLFTVGEDVGHIGSKAFDVTPVRSRMAFVPDADGPVGQIVLAAPWATGVRVRFHGRAAHAGMDPQNGRSSLSMAARAIDRMKLGRIDDQTTTNVGTLAGGQAVNIVPPEAELVFQVRSLDHQKHDRHLDAMLDCCRQGAAAFGGRLEHEVVGGTQGYRFDPDAAVIRRAESAARAARLEPKHIVTCGGSDANELNAKGLATCVLSVGYRDIHTHIESMPIDQLNQLARFCAELMRGK